MRVMDRGLLFMLPWVLTGLFCFAVAARRAVGDTRQDAGAGTG
ncbi:MAG TPA: hypothetical protein VGX48_10420 [Pyrinomonadaceae bacterium]|nr:hypothetical protein [Pyrinomonadaceae bacterium]